MLLSFNVQFEHVAGKEIVQTTILSEHEKLKLCRPVILSGNAQSDYEVAGEVFKQRYYRNINILRPVGQC